MSFREKSAWISILAMTGIYASYFWRVFHSGPKTDAFHWRGLLDTIIALVVVQTVLTIAAAISAPREATAPRDERDRLIDLRATRLAYAALAGSLACLCFLGGVNPPIIFNVNALLSILVIAEILRSGCTIVQYRRGA